MNPVAAPEVDDTDDAGLDETDFDTPAFGGLSQLTSTPEAHKYAELIMKDYRGDLGKNAQAESGLERHEKERAQAQREVARRVREQLAQEKYDQSDRYLSLASAVTQPAASPAQGMGYVATALNDANRRQRTWQEAHDANVNKADVQVADFGNEPEAYSSDLDALSLKLLQSKQRLQGSMATEALRQLGRSTTKPTGAQDPVARIQDLLETMPPNDPRRKALEARITLLTTRAPKTDPNAAVPLTTDDEASVKLAAHYRMNPTTMLGRVSGEKRQAMINKMQEENPAWDEKGWQNLQLARKQYTDQSPNAPGGQVRAFNTSVEHLDTLRELALAIKNGNVQSMNAAKNYFVEHFGGSAPTNLAAATALVASEIANAIVAGRSGVSEREEYAKLMKASSSPKQMLDLIDKVYQPLMASKMNQHRGQFLASLPEGSDPSEVTWFNKRISDRAWQLLDPGHKIRGIAPRSATPGAMKTTRSPAAQAALDTELQGVQ